MSESQWQKQGATLSHKNACKECWRRLKTDHLCRLKIDQGI